MMDDGGGVHPGREKQARNGRAKGGREAGREGGRTYIFRQKAHGLVSQKLDEGHVLLVRGKVAVGDNKEG